MPDMSTAQATAKALLGRPRGFDREVALRTALHVFWRNGYEATSLDQLCAAMGLRRSSFYACFGSKHAAMMDAVRLYADELFASLVARVAAHDDPREAVRAVLGVIADVNGGCDGCLFVNTVAELAPGDAELVTYAQMHTARVGALMSATLVRAGCNEGEASQRAGAMLAMAIGITTLRKTGVPAAQLIPLLAQADHLLPAHLPMENSRS